MVAFSTLRNFHADKYESAFDNPYTYAWMISQIISSFYALTWDLRMDWGLFDKNAGENTLLREEIVYSSAVSMMLYLFIVRDIMPKFLLLFPVILLLRYH